MTDISGTGAIEAAAWFVADQPGWIERTLARCIPNEDGDCEGCGTYRRVRWPCVQVWIAGRAQAIVRERRAPRVAGRTAVGVATPTVVALCEAPERPERRGGIAGKASA